MRPQDEHQSASDGNSAGATTILAAPDRLLPDIEALYKVVRSHPELSMQETRTASIAAAPFSKRV
jgi:hippurate hydrolase